jgi:hypothetical protein
MSLLRIVWKTLPYKVLVLFVMQTVYLYVYISVIFNFVVYMPKPDKKLFLCVGQTEIYTRHMSGV